MPTDEEIQAVWEKGTVVSPYDARQYRKDACGAWIARSAHGNRNGKLGWEIDHIDPNGGESLNNKRPLQWENNLSKSDGKLVCKVTADGDRNIYR